MLFSIGAELRVDSRPVRLDRSRDNRTTENKRITLATVSEGNMGGRYAAH